MNSIKFNDWQEMALKKDTETIIKKLNSHEPIFFSLCWEIVIAVGTIIVDHLFDTTEVNMWVWLICATLAIIPPAIVIIVKSVQYIIALKKSYTGVYNVKHFVDTFDNQICYWVMMSSSYSRILENLPGDRATERIFLYQEGCYYNNKSLQALYEMKPVIDKVFSSNSKAVIKNNLVAVYRLQNLLEMIKQYQQELDTSINDIKTNQLISDQMQINKSIKDNFADFVDDINSLFHTTLNF